MAKFGENSDNILVSHLAEKCTGSKVVLARNCVQLVVDEKPHMREGEEKRIVYAPR